MNVGHQYRILLIDDDDETADIFRRFGKSEGVHVHHESNLAGARALLGRFVSPYFDLAILDVSLVGEFGCEIERELDDKQVKTIYWTNSPELLKARQVMVVAKADFDAVELMKKIIADAEEAHRRELLKSSTVMLRKMTKSVAAAIEFKRVKQYG